MKVFSEEVYWALWECLCLPNGHFVYADQDPPVIQTPFYFFKNNSDELITPTSDPVTLEGAVDIVVAMRDQGEFARSKDNGFGDRLCVNRIEYEIIPVSSSNKANQHYQSFDFEKLKFKNSIHFKEYSSEIVDVVFKHYKHIGTKPSSSKTCCYYIITNCPKGGPPHELKIADQNHCWKTNEKNEQGNPRFPNGLYDIAVTAYDFKGNKAIEVMRVRVANAYLD